MNQIITCCKCGITTDDELDMLFYIINNRGYCEDCAPEVEQ